METMASRFERRIRKFDGIAGTTTTIFTFKDGSRLKFDLSPNPNPQATGEKTSDANQFASSVKFFTTIVDGFEYTFQDDSKMTYNLKGAATTSF